MEHDRDRKKFADKNFFLCNTLLSSLKLYSLGPINNHNANKKHCLTRKGCSQNIQNEIANIFFFCKIVILNSSPLFSHENDLCTSTEIRKNWVRSWYRFRYPLLFSKKTFSIGNFYFIFIFKQLFCFGFILLKVQPLLAHATISD